MQVRLRTQAWWENVQEYVSDVFFYLLFKKGILQVFFVLFFTRTAGKHFIIIYAFISIVEVI